MFMSVRDRSGQENKRRVKGGAKEKKECQHARERKQAAAGGPEPNVQGGSVGEIYQTPLVRRFYCETLHPYSPRHWPK
ncbi:hypothetical protein LMH87_006651 [Akanthomyces muscarius]|uniref:Uncharacterized protein n=1 Tax=Akanthomyces muscarius TaxID=2231603 RepID=A0A9W8QN80_AKAMU|nr:hypothetical protein LMH87_006651 [Akanthomyces muscarius]KAJ4165001.1 hypothetical protein LMH87_006651 [Akanthomyces muscarius]